MKLVVDTNRVIASLVKDSFSRKIIFYGNLELISIKISEKEIEKYKEEILNKSKLTKSQFDSIYEKINGNLIILDDLIIKDKMKEAKKIMDKVDPDDTPFIAAALATKSGIWSDDRHFEKQNKVKIYKTKELIDLLKTN